VYFQDLPIEWLNGIIEILRLDKDICIQNTIRNRIEFKLSNNKLVQLQNEEVDEWLNCNNNQDNVITCLKEFIEIKGV